MELDRYVDAARRRMKALEAQRRRHVERAWVEAKRLGALLVREFGATAVWVFGSLAGDRRGRTVFHLDSDIDLAVRGIPPESFFRAYGRVMGDSDFNVDLVDVDACVPQLRKAIVEEGIPIEQA